MHVVIGEKIDHLFAFLATYSTRDARGKVRHMPLSYALTEYREDRKKLLDLLSCLNRASEVSPLHRLLHGVRGDVPPAAPDLG